MASPDEDLFGLLGEEIIPAHLDVSNLLRRAVDCFDPENPAPLLSLLSADSLSVSSRGLFIFGALGRKGHAALDAALGLTDHPWDGARSDLMDGVISYRQELTPHQANKILRMASDKADLVREKIVTYIGGESIETLRSAISMFSQFDQKEYYEGLSMLESTQDGVQKIFDHMISEVSIRSTFSLASIERLAREGAVGIVPQYTGQMYMGMAVSRNAQRLASRAARRRSGDLKRR